MCVCVGECAHTRARRSSADSSLLTSCRQYTSARPISDASTLPLRFTAARQSEVPATDTQTHRHTDTHRHTYKSKMSCRQKRLLCGAGERVFVFALVSNVCLCGTLCVPTHGPIIVAKPLNVIDIQRSRSLLIRNTLRWWSIVACTFRLRWCATWNARTDTLPSTNWEHARTRKRTTTATTSDMQAHKCATHATCTRGCTTTSRSTNPSDHQACGCMTNLLPRTCENSE